jgi:polar amino acid transport system substrate-binding protein
MRLSTGRQAAARQTPWRSVAVLLLTILAMPATTVLVQNRQLYLVSTAWPPFTNAPGQPRFALDLVNEALKRIGISADTTIVEAARFTPSLLGGKFDGSPALWRDTERERVLLYSDPYLQNRLILVGRTGSDVTAASFAALKGKRIALVEGYSYGDAVSDATGAIFVRTPSEEDSLTRLLRGAVDYVLMDDFVVQYIVHNHGEQARSRLQIGAAPMTTRSLHLAVSRRLPDAASIVKRFNTQLRGMVIDRSYHRLLQVEWIRADVDDDGQLEYVPAADRTGPAAPQGAYDLFVTDKPEPAASKGERYFLGGSMYPDWASVPDYYKVRERDRPDPVHSAVPLFSFTW